MSNGAVSALAALIAAVTQVAPPALATAILARAKTPTTPHDHTQVLAVGEPCAGRMERGEWTCRCKAKKPEDCITETATAPMVSVPLATARMVRQVCLPHNPNKCRGWHPEALAAVRNFIAAVEAADGK